MNLAQLQQWLNEHNVPQHFYSLLQGGLPNESLCLVCENQIWQVYYCERGQKNGLKSFRSEEEACLYFQKKMRKYTTP